MFDTGFMTPDSTSTITEESITPFNQSHTTNIAIANTPTFNGENIASLSEDPNSSSSPFDTETFQNSNLTTPITITKKRRCIKSFSQKEKLYGYWMQNQTPDNEDLKAIAKDVGLNYEQVYKWFWELKQVKKKNIIKQERKTEKKLKKQTGYNTYICQKIYGNFKYEDLEIYQSKLNEFKTPILYVSWTKPRK